MHFFERRVLSLRIAYQGRETIIEQVEGYITSVPKQMKDLWDLEWVRVCPIKQCYFEWSSLTHNLLFAKSIQSAMLTSVGYEKIWTNY